MTPQPLGYRSGKQGQSRWTICRSRLVAFALIAATLLLVWAVIRNPLTVFAKDVVSTAGNAAGMFRAMARDTPAEKGDLGPYTCVKRYGVSVVTWASWRGPCQYLVVPRWMVVLTATSLAVAFLVTAAGWSRSRLQSMV